MLFNSYIFIFLFLPISLLGFFLIGKQGHHRIATSWLVACSLFFYGWWNPSYLGLIIASVLFNYAVGISLSSEKKRTSRKKLLTFGVGANLALLGYYKYAGFFVDNLNLVLGYDLNFNNIVLPLAISFFTFQQIAYLVDAYKGETREYSFLHYCLFVTFFPQLIAGPIVHHKEMLPQFARDSIYQYSAKFKKVVLADGISVYATPAFQAADQGVALTLFEAWGGVLAYTLQLYFDFSGYSDMAIGIARMFGVRLPLNFNSPYKAANIIEFWRRWHMTLSRFLKDYLYIPLGGNKKGSVRKQLNLIITMVLGGLWHGAGWNFVLWGTLHGFYLAVNHLWRMMIPIEKIKNPVINVANWFITFLAVVVAWVPFRAETLGGAKYIWMGMLGVNGITIGNLQEVNPYLWQIQKMLTEHGVIVNGYIKQYKVPDDYMFMWILTLIVIVLLVPNTQQFMGRYRPAFEVYKDEISPAKWYWRVSQTWAVVVSVIMTAAILNLSRVSEFLYFQF